jgi:hypothetical protein
MLHGQSHDQEIMSAIMAREFRNVGQAPVHGISTSISSHSNNPGWATSMVEYITKLGIQLKKSGIAPEGHYAGQQSIIATAAAQGIMIDDAAKSQLAQLGLQVLCDLGNDVEVLDRMQLSDTDEDL